MNPFGFRERFCSVAPVAIHKVAFFTTRRRRLIMSFLLNVSYSCPKNVKTSFY